MLAILLIHALLENKYLLFLEKSYDFNLLLGVGRHRNMVLKTVFDSFFIKML